ncbi:hypothetical protein GW17_00028653 [Ensete ventricosum]|nr:hypothetical protein GW17_00028653 [Ensete ventricosum]
MEAYKLWVRRNSEFVHSLESLANGITWLLPERFSNSEIGSEADVETVVEVAAQQFVGEERKWNYLAVTETYRAFVRLTAFRDSGYKMLLQGGELVNMNERLEVSGVYHARNGDSGMSGGYNRPEHIHGYHGSTPRSLEGRAISALSRFGENAKMASNPMWLNKLCPSSEAAPGIVFTSIYDGRAIFLILICSSISLYMLELCYGLLVAAPLFEKPTFSTLWFQKGLSGRLFLTGEVLSVLRPLIYVLFIRRYGIRSWKPWLISLAMDLAGMSLLSHSTTWHHRSNDKFYQLSTYEKDEASVA